MAKTILLTEDDPFICDIYSSQLKKEGYIVDIANDGQMALQKIKDHVPDLLLLDIELPKEPNGAPEHEEGWDILKTLRDDPATKDLKVIVISNLDKTEYAENIDQFRVTKYFMKIETTVEEIKNTVREILK